MSSTPSTAAPAAPTAAERKAAWRRKEREKRDAQVAARATARAELLASMDETALAAFHAAEQAEFDRLYDEKMAQYARVDAAYAGGLAVVVDLSYAERMSAKEQASLARQLSPLWGANRRAAAPVQLHFAGLGRCPPGCLPKGGEDLARWKVHLHQSDVVDAFPLSSLVFLSPDADEPLPAEPDPRSVYVLGGLIDAQVQKCQTLDRARGAGARAMRLPLAEHAPSIDNPRLPLTLTACIAALLEWNAGAAWPAALQAAIAPRHLQGRVAPGQGRAARRAAARLARGAADDGGREHSYALLVTAGLEDVCAAAIEREALEGCAAVSLEIVAPPPLQAGFAAGPAGGSSPLLARSAQPLPAAALCHPCIAAALALVVYEAALPDDAVRSAADVARRVPAAAFARALRTLKAHRRERPPDERTFRVATLRGGGAHAFTSKEVDAALADHVSALQPRWRVDLSRPDVLVVAVVLHRTLLVGVALPPFAPRAAHVLPLEPRAALVAGRERPHTRPARAAALLRLAAVRDGEVLLDPCGGIGVIALEAAGYAAVHALTIDVDGDASACAAANARRAAAAGLLRGAVSVVHGDAAAGGVAPASVDVAVADLPFGLAHARLDVAQLLVTLARLLRPGGRALLLGGGGPSGSAAAARKAARKRQPGVWAERACVECRCGGIDAVAVVLERSGSV